MRDRVVLATDIYWPDGSAPADLAPRPVLLERSPYDVRAMRGSDGLHASGEPVSPESGAAFFVGRGYVVVRQDCRGQGGSEGAFAKYVNEAEDGYDTHEWIAAQPWCDGTIVTHGVSYSAHTQAAAASISAPHFAAMILDSGGFSSAFDAGGRFGGAFELKQAIWSLRRAGHDIGSPETLAAWFGALPWRRGFSPLTPAQDYEDFLFDQWSHENLDEYWRQPGLYARGYYDAFPPVPVLNISSWYDPYVFTAVENFQMLRKRNSRSALVLGPWTHGARSVSWAGDVDFGPAAPLDGNLAPDYLEFKDKWLRAALGAGGEPAVRYFLMGGGSGRRIRSGRMDHGGRWCVATEWPPSDAEPLHLYLGADQSLRWEPAPAGALTYDFDPRDPVPSRGGGITTGEPLMWGGAFDQTFLAGVTPLPLSARHDVLTFQTDPLAAPVALAGRVAVHLRFSSSAPDTDVAVKLVDVHPPNADYPHGYAMNVTDGMLRCRHRDDPAHPAPLEPGREYDLVIPMPDAANVFGTGHRIRVDVTSSNFPRCDVNPNTGGPVMGARTFTIARNTVHTGQSSIRLDVVPIAG